jgi:hypothetical protein
VSVRGDIPDDRREAFMATCAAGRACWKSGDLAGAEARFLEAWDLIPEPKVEWDYSQSLSSGFVTFYRDTGQPAKALPWIDTVAAIYDASPASETHVAMFRGTVLFEMGDLDGALEAFRPQFEKHGKRPFAGEDPKFLKFVTSRLQKKR